MANDKVLSTTVRRPTGGTWSNFVGQLPQSSRKVPHSGRKPLQSLTQPREGIMRVFIAAILILSNGAALSAEPLAPTPTQKYRMACNASQISVVQACRARCDEAVHECI